MSAATKTMSGPTKVSVPTPFEVGDVNAYVFEDDGITVVDPGPDTDVAYEALSENLQGLGYDTVDITEVVVTHPHIDHFGLASRLHEESGCRIHAHEDAIPVIEDYEAHYQREKRYFRVFLREMGMPKNEAGAVVELPGSFTMLAPPVEPDALVSHEEGDSLPVSPALEPLETPGHCMGTLSYRLDDYLISGDHLMAEITPNPNLQIPEDGERPRSLHLYLSSLEELRELDLDRALPGHGLPVEEPEERIERTLEHHEKRKQRLLSMVEDQPQTAYELMQEMWSGLPSTEYFFGMSEVVGHMDLLEMEDEVELRGDDVKTYHTV